MEYLKLISEYPELFSNESAPIQIITDPTEIAHWQELKRKDLVNSGKPEEWAEIGIVLDDPYLVIIRDLVKFSDGNMNGYIRLFHRSELESGNSNAVAILPELNGKFCLIHQFRHSTRCWHYEIPRGFGEPGVSSERQAYWEIVEEIGGEIDVLINLGILHFNTGIAGSYVNIFLAHLRSIGELNSQEGIESIRWVSRDELEEMIASSKITDSFTITAYTRAKLRGIL